MSVEEGKQRRENRKAKDRKDTRPMRCRAAGRCGSILPLTTILTIGYETFSPTLINVATHSQFINTSIIWGGGLDETESFSVDSLTVQRLCKDKTARRPAAMLCVHHSRFSSLQNIPIVTSHTDINTTHVLQHSRHICISKMAATTEISI